VKIYHGTTAAVAKRALAEGLKPRNATGKSNWKHSVESNPSLIYLTTTYAPYYALQGAQKRKGEKIAIIEIETDLLDETKMRPDEDFIEQVTRRDKKNSAGIVGDTMNERTAYIRNHIDEFDKSWKLSVEHVLRGAGTHHHADKFQNLRQAIPVVEQVVHGRAGHGGRMVQKSIGEPAELYG